MHLPTLVACRPLLLLLLFPLCCCSERNPSDMSEGMVGAAAAPNPAPEAAAAALDSTSAEAKAQQLHSRLHGPSPWLEPVARLSPLSCLPQLLCIGAQKSGTTSLYHYLAKGFHPGLAVPAKVKETHFFNRRLDKGDQSFVSYTRLFPGVSSQDDPPQGVCSHPASLNLTEADPPSLVRAELTPAYLFHPSVPARVKQHLPEARFVVLLRNPVSRTISNFNHRWQKRHPASSLSKLTSEEVASKWLRTLNKTISSELITLERCYSKCGGRKDETHSTAVERCLGFKKLRATDLTKALDHIELVWRSVYADQLERWMELYPPSSFLLWVSEDFKSAPVEHLQQLVEWLGLDPSKSAISHASPNHAMSELYHVRSYPAAAPTELLRRLQDFLDPQTRRLYRLLDKKGFGQVAGRLREVWEAQAPPPGR